MKLGWLLGQNHNLVNNGKLLSQQNYIKRIYRTSYFYFFSVKRNYINRIQAKVFYCLIAFLVIIAPFDNSTLAI